MKYLVVGDTHTKLPILWKVKELSPKYDKIIFLGDYVDEWDTPAETSYNFLNELIQFKKENLDKIILIGGNHDCSNWFEGVFICSGYDRTGYKQSLLKPLFQNNQELFDICYFDTYMFSHGGFTSGWVKELFKQLKITQKEYKPILKNNPQWLADLINESFHSIIKQEPDPLSVHNKIFFKLADVSAYRGGTNNFGSPLWADYDELITNPLPYLNQIVGHTPVHTISFHHFKNGDSSSNELIFCDTFSLYSDHTPIGDNSVLEFDSDTLRTNVLSDILE